MIAPVPSAVGLVLDILRELGEIEHLLVGYTALADRYRVTVPALAQERARLLTLRARATVILEQHARAGPILH